MTARQGSLYISNLHPQQTPPSPLVRQSTAGALPKTPLSILQHDNPRCDYFTAQRAAELSFSPSAKTPERSPGVKQPNDTALIAARAIALLHPPSPSPQNQTQGKLSRKSSYETGANNGSLQAAQLSVKKSNINLSRSSSTENILETDSTGGTSNGSTAGSSLRAAQLSVKRSSAIVLSRSSSDEKAVHSSGDAARKDGTDNESIRAAQLSVKRAGANLSRNNSTDAVQENRPGVRGDGGGALIAAKMSAARAKEAAPKPPMSNSTLAASRAVIRSTAAAQPERDQPEVEVLPSKGSVLEAKKRLLQQTDVAKPTKDSQPADDHTLSPSSIRRRFESQGANGISSNDEPKSPTPVRLGTSSANQQDSMTAAIRAVRDSPPKSVSVLKSSRTPILSRSTSPEKEVRVSVVPKKPPKKPAFQALSRHQSSRSFDGKINPPEVFLVSAPVKKATTGDSALTAASRAASAAAESSRRTPAPPPPQARGTRTRESKTPQPDTSTVDHDLYFTTPSSSTNQNTVYGNARIAASTSYLPARATPNARTMSTQSLTTLPRNATGPEMGSKAAALAFKNPAPSWRDDLSYLSQSASQLNLHPNSTGESLRHAVAASSLASSRAPSPQKTLLPPPTIRMQSGLRTTMRKPDKSEERELSPPKKKKHLVKHPNKHHEGTRQRWRETITEKERRRYEGLWAANRGLYLPEPSPEDTSIRDGVCSVIVRDLWNRSRLPSDILENIWNLVDRKGRGWLSREEFLMGLWLIDQSLKGRKLPGRVHPGTWESINRLNVVLKDYKTKPIKAQKSGR